MPLFKWKEEYSVHNDDLDRHHQYFIAILNGLYDNCFEAKLDDVDKKIDELLETVGFYFSAEEEYMRECGYPGWKIIFRNTSYSTGRSSNCSRPSVTIIWNSPRN